MSLRRVEQMSLGQYLATVQGWAAAHGAQKTKAPSEDEFDLAVMAARGVA